MLNWANIIGAFENKYAQARTAAIEQQREKDIKSVVEMCASCYIVNKSGKLIFTYDSKTESQLFDVARLFELNGISVRLDWSQNPKFHKLSFNMSKLPDAKQNFAQRISFAKALAEIDKIASESRMQAVINCR